jgi:hypothetical protein
MTGLVRIDACKVETVCSRECHQLVPRRSQFNIAWPLQMQMLTSMNVRGYVLHAEPHDKTTRTCYHSCEMHDSFSSSRAAGRLQFFTFLFQGQREVATFSFLLGWDRTVQKCSLLLNLNSRSF